MKNITAFLLLLSILLGPASLSSLAEDDLDTQCSTFCNDNGHEEGYYLAPENDAKCDEGFSQIENNPICCCKQTEKES